MQPQYPYPPQQPAPQQYAPPMPQYPAQQPPAPQYPQQQYGVAQYPPAYAQPPAPAAPPPPPGTLDQFYSQPSAGGGPSFKFMDAARQPQIGKSYAGFVARPVTDADIRAQTDNNGRVQTYKDGRTKYVMVVPMQVQPSQEFPDGQAGWWVKGQARDELARAMAEAGAPQGPPEAGAFIRVTLVGVRPVPNMNPAYQYRVEYVRPNGAAPVPGGGPVEQHDNPSAPEQATYTQAQGYTGPQYTPVQQVPVVSTATGAPVVHQQAVPVPAPVQQPIPAAAPAPVATQPVAAATQPVAAAQQAPAGFSPEQAELFARLTGQQQG